MENRSISTPVGFSLAEFMVAMTITLGVSLIIFQVFVQSGRVLRHQALVLETQQNVRAVGSMIADDLRKAGQGIPIYASSVEGSNAEASQTFLEGTNRSAIRFRAGVRNGTALTRVWQTYSVGTPGTLAVDLEGASKILNLVGAATGRHLYIWGPTANAWTWVRAEIIGFHTPNTIQIVPRQISRVGGGFRGAPHVSLEEGLSYRLSGERILRGVSRDFTSVTTPTFTESVVADGFTALAFRYYDRSGTAIDPSTLALRASIRRVDFVLDGETSKGLADGESQHFGLRISVRPRNLEID